MLSLPPTFVLSQDQTLRLFHSPSSGNDNRPKTQELGTINLTRDASRVSLNPRPTWSIVNNHQTYQKAGQTDKNKAVEKIND